MKKNAVLLSSVAAVLVLGAGAGLTYWHSRSEEDISAVALPTDATDPAANSDAASEAASETALGGVGSPASAGEDSAEFADDCSFHPPAGPAIDGTKVKNYKFDHVPSDRTESGVLGDGTAFSLRASGCADFLTEELSFEAPAGETHPPAAWLAWWHTKLGLLPLAATNTMLPAAQAFSLIETRLGELHPGPNSEFMICMNGNIPGGTDCKDRENKSITCPQDCGWDDGGAGTLKIEKMDTGTTRVTISESTSA